MGSPAGASAQAARVVLLRSVGSADLEMKEELDATVSRTLRGLGFHVLSEGAAMEVEEEVIPETANDLRAIAELQNATYTLQPIIHDASAEAYWVTFRAGYAPDTRVEELDAEIRVVHEEERLQQLLAALMRPAGLGEEAHALAGQDAAGRQQEQDAADAEAAAAAEAERQRLAAEEAEREAERERAAQEAADAEAAAERAFDERDRYGVADGLMMLSGGLGVRGLVKSGGDGGALGSFELQFGRGFESIPGLELRAGLGLYFGAAGAFDLHVGAAYLTSLFAFPLHLGAILEGGLFMPITGQRSPGGMVRFSALASYNVTGNLYAELSLPAFTWLSNGGGAIGIGASIHLGARF
ncbi:MAG: hypothetical protein CMN30_28605 [Sandaracinus sp.]|nr:hypothetical protein [Sandaracinus sp.]